MTDITEPGVTHCDRPERVGPIGHALFRVSRAHRIAAGNLLRDLGLYPGQEIMLSHLAEHGDQRQSALVLALAIDPSTVTKMLQRLERQGLVERRPCPQDRRVSLVAITEAGRALTGRIADSWSKLESITTGGLTEDDRRRLADLLAHVEDNLVDGRRGATVGRRSATVASVGGQRMNAHR